MWAERELNPRHKDFQSFALPTDIKTYRLSVPISVPNLSNFSNLMNLEGVFIMYLSKLSNGVYHIYYFKEDGKKTKISTHTKYKSEAYKFLSNFEQEFKNRQQNKLSPIAIKKFTFEFLKYSETIHSSNHTKSLKTSFNEFIKFAGNISLETLIKK